MDKLPEKNYYADPALSFSKAKLFHRNAFEYHKVYIEKSLPEFKSPATIFGNKFHCYILEPHKIVKDYMTSEQIRYEFFKYAPYLEKEYKEKPLTRRSKVFNEWLKMIGEPEIITTDEQILLEQMKKSSLQAITDHFNNAFSENKGLIPPEDILSVFHKEEEIYWKDERTGLDLKTKIDLLLPPFKGHGGILMDLKSIQELLNAERMERHIEEMGYHLQAKFNIDGFKHKYKSPYEPVYLWCIVEKVKGRHFAIIFHANHALLERGHSKFNEILDNYMTALETNYWPFMDYEKIDYSSYPAHQRLEACQPIGVYAFAK